MTTLRAWQILQYAVPLQYLNAAYIFLLCVFVQVIQVNVFIILTL